MHGKSVDGSRDWLAPEPHPRESEQRNAAWRKKQVTQRQGCEWKGKKHGTLSPFFPSLWYTFSLIPAEQPMHKCLHTSTGVLSSSRCHLLVQSGDSSLNVRCLTASRQKVAVWNALNHLFLLSPLTHSYGPGSDDPQGDTEDQQHSSRADGHQSLHHKACVKVHLKRENNHSVKSIWS